MAGRKGTDAPPTSNADADAKAIATGTGAAPQDSRGSPDTARAPAPGARERTAADSSADGAQLTTLERFKIKCLNSALYHDDRERFFAWVNRILMFTVVVFGMSVLSPIRDKYPLIPIVTAIAGLVNLVFDINGSARLHGSLRQRLYGVLADAEVMSDIPSLEKRLILIYADEPPIMYAVNAIAFNNAMLSYGRPKEKLMNVGFFSRFIRHLWPYSANSFRTYSEVAAH